MRHFNIYLSSFWTNKTIQNRELSPLERWTMLNLPVTREMTTVTTMRNDAFWSRIRGSPAAQSNKCRDHINIIMNKTDSGSTLAFSGLPKPFLEAMGKLFEMLDDNGDGWIHYSGKFWTLLDKEKRESSTKVGSCLDVSKRWNPCHAQLNQNLPKNILENLKKVTTQEGLLSFERFCAGLKIAILRHEAEKNRLIRSTDLQNSKQDDITDQQDIEVRYHTVLKY